ncbi:Alcohol dehydrogenase zinc-binding domain protein [Glaciecola sp. 4H-3-7+YE-5]|jgi:NADPH:quinone reductase-like Zn-dependent oxidoreductase|uniref:quinone oxidoreductase family protein n=1 Tax=uncultured Alteromonas sp. TaxID=179113 RepID=UPI00020A739D|nr:Alcohol dehydrogenase zinc-binding domain protein [Glaciecola sp. 4H-3-7+YE-5]|tara:strand:- start:2422 stop:3351 length:930 start_codon:yes stop_codon:yes gene_type:complete
MKAAILNNKGASPIIQQFETPSPQQGCILINVDTAGLGGWDVLGAYRLGVEFPCVIRGEGVGKTNDGRRVYFGERSVRPYGAWAEQTLVPEEEVWDVPDDIDDITAINMGIAATGAWIPLQQANIQNGENVLILGATGVLGQMALQFARHMGAAHIVAAARSEDSLKLLKQKGLADDIVVLSEEPTIDQSNLKKASNEGFDVVLDLVCGQPLLNALKATRWGARIHTVGTGAGRQINLDIADLLFRTLTCIGTGQRPASDRQKIWQNLLQYTRDHTFEVDHHLFTLDDAAGAWGMQINSPHAKIVAKVR